jgi:hypothetical protein
MTRQVEATVRKRGALACMRRRVHWEELTPTRRSARIPKGAEPYTRTNRDLSQMRRDTNETRNKDRKLIDRPQGFQGSPEDISQVPNCKTSNFCPGYVYRVTTTNNRSGSVQGAIFVDDQASRQAVPKKTRHQKDKKSTTTTTTLGCGTVPIDIR